MAFDSTVRAILAQTKRCTRRPAESVARLHPGALLRAVNRRHGLRRGERARTLAVLRVEELRPAPPLTPDEVELEGFPGKSVAFVESILRSMYGGVRPLVRVQFSYVAIAAPRLLEIGVDSPDVLVDLAWGGDLKHLPRGDPQRGELRALQRLGREEMLLRPATFAAVCSALQLDPLELWRKPGAPRERARARRRRTDQLNLF